MVIMDNLQLAHEHDAEQTLWTRHVEVCSLFKKALRVVSDLLLQSSLHILTMAAV